LELSSLFRRLAVSLLWAVVFLIATCISILFLTVGFMGLLCVFSILGPSKYETDVWKAFTFSAMGNSKVL